ncbi:MAG: hypothetical protein ACE5KX_07555 [Acidimicrobiia bacterium]
MAVRGVRRIWLPTISRRTMLGAALAAAAALLVLALTGPDSTVPILTAGEDLPAGVPLDELPLEVRHVTSADGLVEGDSVGALSGWSLSAPIRKGEPLLPSLLRPPAVQTDPDLFSLAVPESHAVLGRLAGGDTIDIYVTWPAGFGEAARTELLAEDVHVVEARAETGGLGGDAEVQLLLAVDEALAAELAASVQGGELDIVKVGP